MKKQKPKPTTKPGDSDQEKTPRFEYHGKPASNVNNPSSSKQKQTNKNTTNKATQLQGSSIKTTKQDKDLTIQEDFTAEQLEKLSKKYKDSLKIENANKQQLKVPNSAQKTTSSSSTSDKKNTTGPKLPVSAGDVVKKAASTTKLANTSVGSTSQPKRLATLVEKRKNLKIQLKRNIEPSAQDRETFKRQALQTKQEYNELTKSCRPRVNLVVVGHVDAGKSTLVGHLLYKLGQVSGKQMHRNEVDSQRSGKASFKYAWALDETNEERARGVTIDIALTQFETQHRDVVLLDAPGHVDFIPAVISGAAQADAALLVVDATRGEFETGFTTGGQTREHTFLVRSLGVKSLVVVVNKMDNVDWSSARFGDIIDQLKPFLKQVGFNLKEDVQFVVASGLTGENLVERRVDKVIKQSSHPQLEDDGGNWQNMPSLLEAIDKIKEPERLVDKPTRVCVTDVFKGMSSGVFLGGKVVGGKLECKQKLLLLPPNETCEVKQVDVRDNNRALRAFAGDIVTATVTGIDMNKYYRGCMLSDPLIPCQVTNRFQARIIMFQSVNAILVKGMPIEVHINGTYESGEVRRLISLLNKNTGELIQQKPRCIAKNSSAIIQLKLARVVCCELYEDNKDLGRFMMRSYGQTIAAGLITKIKSPKVEKNRTKMKSK